MSIGVTYADVTLFGTIDQAYSKTETSNNTGTLTSTTTIAGVQNGDSGIGFKGSEDLGNGMKASFLHELGVSTQGAAATSVRQAYVALGGAFGQVRIGKQYSQAFNNTVTVDPMGATGVYGHNSYGVLLSGGSTSAGDEPLRQTNGLQYTLPAFVEGLGLTVTKTFSGTNTVGAAASDGVGLAVNFSSGALYAGYTWDRTDNTGISVAGTPLTAITATATKDRVLETLSASYDLGMAKIGINNAKASVDANNSLDNTALTVGIPVGSAVIGLSTSSGNQKRLGISTNITGYQIGLDYMLSKRTVAYAQMGTSKFDTTDKNKLSSSAFGIRHSF